MFCKRWISRYNKGYNQLVKIGGIVLTIDIKDIENMQNKVKLIRQTLEIGIQDFADLLGVSRQTIYNIENHRKALTQTQYLAICTIINLSIKEQPGKERIISTILSSNYKNAEDYEEVQR